MNNDSLSEPPKQPTKQKLPVLPAQRHDNPFDKSNPRYEAEIVPKLPAQTDAQAEPVLSVAPSDKTGSLGNIAEIASTVSLSRKIRYYLQSIARQLILYHKPTRGKHKGEMVQHKIVGCLRYLAPHKGGDGVEVMYSSTMQKARYRNLRLCACLWVCPPCASRITEGRRVELAQAIAKAPYKTALITYTMAHHKGQRLEPLLEGLLGAYHSLKSGRAWLALKQEYGWVGSIRNLEVTEGSAWDNGWHAHIHELVFLPADMEEHWFVGLQSFIRQRWQYVLRKQGFDASLENGVVLEMADERIKDYIAKYGHEPIDGGWTLEHELVKSNSKVGRSGGGRTPFQLLWDYGAGDVVAGELFKEYAEAFEGRNQLVWSRGLRDLLGMGKEKTDEELVDAPLDENEILLANLTPEQWREVLRLELRSDLLDVAGRGDVAQLEHWMNEQGIPLIERRNATDEMWRRVDEKSPIRRK